ncbi:MAG: alpha/beta hydrolase [Acidimicrobiia bacterium]|nr:alpha/beta hydrolase [Acidimicrobiia bacterium]
MQQFFQDAGMNFDVLIGLGFAYANIADVGETLATIERIPNGDDEAWVKEWTATAERLHKAASESESGGHRASARARFLRASTYYDHASAHAPGTSDSSRFTALWEKHRQCWDKAITLFDTPVEPVEIPYEDTKLEGYFFKADSSAQARPTVILNNGSDGPVISQWSQGGRAAVERGWNAITFDGPGQGAALHRQNLYFRHDWEAVITPVVDYLLTRSDVDPAKIVLHGVSQAGYWAPRAAAFEHRLAALVADPGVIRVATSWEVHYPPDLLTLIDDGNQKDFDALVDAGIDPSSKAMLAWRMAPYGTSSPFEALVAARNMTLDPSTIQQIQCPTLVLDPENEQFWPGQSQQLFDGLTCTKQLAHFTAAEGADWHCEPAAQSLRNERVFDFLEDTIG